MRRIFLYMLVFSLAFSSNSCTKDPSPSYSGNSVTTKVGGLEKTFNTVVVTQEPYTSGGVNYVDLKITATNKGNTTESLVFSIGKGDLGVGHSWGFNYTINGVYYAEGDMPTTVSSDATINSDNKLKGTFNGTVTSSENVTLQLTEGTFDVSY